MCLSKKGQSGPAWKRQRQSIANMFKGKIQRNEGIYDDWGGGGGIPGQDPEHR